MTSRVKQSVKAPRVWQRMLSGRRLDLADPSPMDVEIEDIAHGLARVARWNGQTRGEHAFSVAEHSVLVEDICRRLQPDLTPQQRLTALLHDSPEYVIGDMISPFKALLGESYKTIEARLQEAIHIRFGLRPVTPQKLKRLIKKADLICAWAEAIQLAGFSEDEANRLFGKPPEGTKLKLSPKAVPDAQAAFMKRYAQINKLLEPS
ncbi:MULTISPECIES: YfbR-like 5'-deoxynucleotidase [Hyphomonas]|mgnify:FL=1|uniref:HD family hydrolase n=2 Tax=Hyphomonas atlantica TaxID=1280948 RepID=A0A356W7N3_9PROT|nr:MULTISPECIES: HD family hydrolase [Hyphomonas]MAH93740.1 HD family hydrolase [Hyphomonas sp.]MAM06832.1 HD family hydrolase [Hyphomonas sp.]OUX84409.1 MAG: phosphohydrolase [Hyphomonas sp. TMED31]HBQ48886.1 HD family hydrolase [Hyphomonas atlantica]